MPAAGGASLPCAGFAGVPGAASKAWHASRAAPSDQRGTSAATSFEAGSPPARRRRATAERRTSSCANSGPILNLSSGEVCSSPSRRSPSSAAGLTDRRGTGRHRRQPPSRAHRPGHHRPGHSRRRHDHDPRIQRLHPVRPAGHRRDRHRPGRRRPARRLPPAHHPRPRPHAPVRPRQLVAARLAGPHLPHLSIEPAAEPAAEPSALPAPHPPARSRTARQPGSGPRDDPGQPAHGSHPAGCADSRTASASWQS
jgi:hypothetical protein